MNKKISLGAAIALMAIIASATFSVTMVYSRQTFNDTVHNIKEREAMYSKLAEIDKWVRQNYYGNLDDSALTDSLAKGYMAGTGDPYAKYLTVEEYSRQNQSGLSKSVGIGVVTSLDETGYIRVEEVYPESPALAADIQPGDLIVRIDETDVTKDNCEELQQSILGEAGTQIDVVVRRDNVDTPHPLTRRDVEKPTVYTNMTEDGVGYVQIVEFGANTADQFSRAVDKLVSEGANSLVFDVRSNQTGPIDQATRILDKLLPQGDIVSATYKDGSTQVLATSDPAFIDLPMVVLTNEKTASSAELFAQALKDYEQLGVKSVGTLTMGKGSMQETQQLSDGSAIDVTVAKYNSPSGLTFDGVGVKPDFEVKLTPDQAAALEALDPPAQDPQLKTLLEFDPQLKKAVELAATAAKTVAPATPAESASGGEDAPSVSEPSSSEEQGTQEDEEESSSEDSSEEEPSQDEE